MYKYSYPVCRIEIYLSNGERVCWKIGDVIALGEESLKFQISSIVSAGNYVLLLNKEKEVIRSYHNVSFKCDFDISI